MAIAIRDDAGLPRDELDRLSALEPRFGQSFESDTALATRYFAGAQLLIDRLPPRPRRSEAAQAAIEGLTAQLRAVRLGFLRHHAARLYMRLTDELRTFVRVEDLVYQAAEAVPEIGRA